MSKKLVGYLLVLGIGLGVVAANRGLAQDIVPINQSACCVDYSRDDRTRQNH